MEKINDGGPAFPSTRKVGSVELTDGGMTLRDYFAAKAMEGLLSSPTDPSSAKAAAEWSYEMADAMLAAREQSEQQA